MGQMQGIPARKEDTEPERGSLCLGPGHAKGLGHQSHAMSVVPFIPLSLAQVSPTSHLTLSLCHNPTEPLTRLTTILAGM